MEDQQKNRVTAGLLGIFLGFLGIHNYYSNEVEKGNLKVTLTLIGFTICIVSILAINFTGPILAYTNNYENYLRILLTTTIISMITFVIGLLLFLTSFILGFIEGLTILVKSEDNRKKSKIAATVFAITLGVFGAHNFYLGFKNKARTQLLITILGAIILVGPIISWIWALIEGIKIISGKINVDASGVGLRE